MQSFGVVPIRDNLIASHPNNHSIMANKPTYRHDEHPREYIVELLCASSSARWLQFGHDQVEEIEGNCDGLEPVSRILQERLKAGPLLRSGARSPWEVRLRQA